MLASPCLFTWLRNYRIFLIIQRLTGQFLKCHRECKKEEECEHHLQRAICAGLIIPTPEVSDMPSREFYDKVYPANYKQPRQLIHMQR
ncbi:hypothetical protein NQ314_007470, partial [Rhamnusium bicolor]